MRGKCWADATARLHVDVEDIEEQRMSGGLDLCSPQSGRAMAGAAKVRRSAGPRADSVRTSRLVLHGDWRCSVEAFYNTRRAPRSLLKVRGVETDVSNRCDGLCPPACGPPGPVVRLVSSIGLCQGPGDQLAAWGSGSEELRRAASRACCVLPACFHWLGHCGHSCAVGRPGGSAGSLSLSAGLRRSGSVGP